MAEFGEQLRKAREEKGMTQQSLAEKVYVTRQTVSRWEGGERYPDLVTVKKLAQVLGVDAGFLLSDDETQHIVERNPVVEKQAVNNVTLVLFAGIVISYIISVIGVLIRIPSMPSVTAADVWVLGGNAVSELIGIAAFVAGFVWVLKGAFSPKKVGAVMMAFFASICIKGLAIFTTGAVVSNWFVAVIPVVIGVIGFVVSYFYFWKKQPAAIWHWLVMIVSVVGIIQALYTLATTVVFAAQYVSAETALNAVLSICIYVLFCYQVHALSVRRKLVSEITDEKLGVIS